MRNLAHLALDTATLGDDGRRLVTTGANIARVWDISHHHHRLLFTAHVERGPVYGVLAPRRPSLLLTVSPHQALVWHVGRAPTVLRGAPSTIASADEGLTDLGAIADFSPNGQAVVVAGDNLATISTVEGRLIARLQHPSTVGAVHFSPDGRLVATSSAEGNGFDSTWSARIWDARNGDLLAVFRANQPRLTSLAFSPDGHRLVTTAEDGTAVVWRVPVPRH